MGWRGFVLAHTLVSIQPGRHGQGAPWFMSGTDADGYVVGVPHALVVAACVVLPARSLLHARRARLRGRRDLCPSCGYDLRATPDRCPECGLLQVEPSAR